MKSNTKVTLKKAETVGFYCPTSDTVYISSSPKWSARRAGIKEGHFIKVRMSLTHLRRMVAVLEDRLREREARRSKKDAADFGL